MTIKLWHCHNSRSLRPLWALEEMEIDYQLIELPFPPRFLKKDYLDVNVLGTVPYFVDTNYGRDVHLTESVAICQYLVDCYQRYDFGLKTDDAEYGEYLNWLHHSDATLTFPQTIKLRYSLLEPKERRQPTVADDYVRWYIARLRKLDAHIKNHQFLVADRFTIADIAVGFALYLGELLDLHQYYQPQTQDYLERLKTRPAFQKAVVIGEQNSNFKGL